MKLGDSNGVYIPFFLLSPIHSVSPSKVPSSLSSLTSPRTAQVMTTHDSTILPKYVVGYYKQLPDGRIAAHPETLLIVYPPYIHVVFSWFPTFALKLTNACLKSKSGSPLVYKDGSFRPFCHFAILPFCHLCPLCPLFPLLRQGCFTVHEWSL